MDSNNTELLKLLYMACVSEPVGKQKQNECSKVKYLSSFVTPSEEDFAILLLGNKVAKWMDELHFGKSQSSNQ